MSLINYIGISNFLHHQFTHVYVMISLLGLCLTVSQAHPLVPYIENQIIYQQQPLITYTQPPAFSYNLQPLFRPHYDFSALAQNYPFLGQPLLPDVTQTEFPIINSTTTKPGAEDSKREELSTPSNENESETVTSIKTPDEIKDVNGTTPPDFRQFFNHPVINNNPITYYPQVSQVFPSQFYPNPFENNLAISLTPTSNNFIIDHLNRLNQAYGVPGFRPFYYDAYMRQINNTRCSDNSTQSPFKSCDNEVSPSAKTTFENPSQTENNNDAIIEVINRLYKNDQNIVIFNTNNPQYQRVSDDKPDEEKIDPRFGVIPDKITEKKEVEEDSFFKVYKDIMFLNKSYLSTFSPYFHK